MRMQGSEEEKKEEEKEEEKEEKKRRKRRRGRRRRRRRGGGGGEEEEEAMVVVVVVVMVLEVALTFEPCLSFGFPIITSLYTASGSLLAPLLSIYRASPAPIRVIKSLEHPCSPFLYDQESVIESQGEGLLSRLNLCQSWLYHEETRAPQWSMTLCRYSVELLDLDHQTDGRWLDIANNPRAKMDGSSDRTTRVKARTP